MWRSCWTGRSAKLKVNRVKTGSCLGPYEILAAIGAGGMGKVYRARDMKLDRDVAIKILRELFAHDAERVARFTREAHVLASLNHQHIDRGGWLRGHAGGLLQDQSGGSGK